MGERAIITSGAYRLYVEPIGAHPATLEGFASYDLAHQFLIDEVATLHPRGGKWRLYRRERLIAMGTWKTMPVGGNRLAVSIRELFHRDNPKRFL